MWTIAEYLNAQHDCGMLFVTASDLIAWQAEAERLQPVYDAAVRIFAAAIRELNLPIPLDVVDNPAEGLGAIIVGMKLRHEKDQKEIKRLREENKLLRLKIEEYVVCYGSGVTLKDLIDVGDAIKAAEAAGGE